jgi:hypothetical protein
VPVRVNTANCLTEREIFQRDGPVPAADQCDRSEEHDDAVSMRDPLVDPTGKSIGESAQVLAKDRIRFRSAPRSPVS